MLAFTRKTDYALIALASLAQEATRAGAKPAAAAVATSTPSGRVLSARSIAERYSVPLPILMNVLKDLVGAELVRSTRGVHGGYALARSSRHITVHDIVQAMEGQPALAMCCDAGEAEPCQECAVETRCPVTLSVRRLNDRINLFLREVTLADLIDGNSHGSQVVPVSSLLKPRDRSRGSVGGNR